MTDQEKPRILMFVEDEPDIVDLYTIAFEQAGFTVAAVMTGNDALKKLEEFVKEDVERPNAMILDILLPDISGMDVLRAARANHIFDNTPVIMFTNFSSDKIKEEIQAMPNTRYLLKMDITPDKLVGIVKEMLHIA